MKNTNEIEEELQKTKFKIPESIQQELNERIFEIKDKLINVEVKKIKRITINKNEILNLEEDNFHFKALLSNNLFEDNVEHNCNAHLCKHHRKKKFKRKKVIIKKAPE